MHQYSSFGFTYTSDLELPGVPLGHQPPEVAIRWDEVPLSLVDPHDAAELYGLRFQASPGSILITIAGVARYLVTDGRDIAIEAYPSASPDQIRVCLMGSAFGALLMQRGVLPLHASVVRINDACVAFCGDAGAGKSTVATACREAGWEVVCDDVSPISLTDEGPLVWPGFPRLKVWSDSLEALGIEYQQFPRVLHKFEKFEMPTTSHSAAPLRLRRIYLLDKLDETSREVASLTRLAEADRLGVLIAHTYRREFLKGLGLREAHFRMSTELLRHLDVVRFARVWDLGQIRPVIDHLQADFPGVVP